MAQILKRGSKNLNTENWKVHHPSGKHMFTCGERKSYWYLLNDLGKVYIKRVDGEPVPYGDGKNIILTFEPRGYGFSSDEVFGLTGRNVSCVVTNETDNLQRHHIVPYCYRRHFTEEYKSKNHHDVVLVTYEVHQAYERHATIYKDLIAKDYSVKSLNECNFEFTQMLSDHAKDTVRMLSGLHSIFRAYGKLSNERILEILAEVSKNTDLSLEFLSGLNYMQLYKLYRTIRDAYRAEFEVFKSQKSLEYDHGYQVVKQLDTHEKIEAFVRRWRTHFVNTMHPPYMPKGWSIDFRVKVEL